MDYAFVPLQSPVEPEHTSPSMDAAQSLAADVKKQMEDYVKQQLLEQQRQLEEWKAEFIREQEAKARKLADQQSDEAGQINQLRHRHHRSQTQHRLVPQAISASASASAALDLSTYSESDVRDPTRAELAQETFESLLLLGLAKRHKTAHLRQDCKTDNCSDCTTLVVTDAVESNAIPAPQPSAPAGRSGKTVSFSPATIESAEIASSSQRAPLALASTSVKGHWGKKRVSPAKHWGTVMFFQQALDSVTEE